MRKVVYKQFGREAILEIVEQEVPLPKKDELLIRVKAVSINPLDWKIYGGEMKLMSGSKFPKAVGIDFSGVIEGTGIEVNRFKTGDEIIGLLDVFKGGALAEYVVAKETQIARKPPNISFEQASALPVTGLSALEIIDNLAAVTNGQEVLINGATGGIGVFAVQIAKERGAKVTAVVGTSGTALATKWGADKVIDYTKQDISLMNKRYDLVVDLSTKLSFKAARKLMKQKATFVTTLPSPMVLIQSICNNLFSAQKMKVLILKPKPDRLLMLSNLAEKGLQIVINKTYPLSEVRKAYQETREQKTTGKTVIVL